MLRSLNDLWNRSLLDGMTDACIHFDWTWRYAHVNEAALRAIARPLEQILASTLWELYPDIVGTELESQYRRAMEERVPAAFDFHYPTLDTWWHNRLFPVPDGLAVFATDITEQRRHENALSVGADELQALSRRLVEVQETERRRLAAELHDQVGQNLTALSINLDILATRLNALEGAADVKRRLQDSLALLEATSRCIEGVLDDLRPPMLDDWGIGPTLQWVADDFARRTEIPARVRVLGTERRIDPQNELALIRIVQEALNNVGKHAHARIVDVTLGWEVASVRVEIADDGTGFEHNRSSGRRGLGLLSMRERMQAAHGLLDIESASGKGTRVRASVPG